MADKHSASVIEPSQRLCETSSSLGRGPELRSLIVGHGRFGLGKYIIVGSNSSFHSR